MGGGHRMTVQELIDELNKVPSHLPVYMYDHAEDIWFPLTTGCIDHFPESKISPAVEPYEEFIGIA